MHNSFFTGHRAGRAAHIPFVRHKLLPVPVAGNQLVVGILHCVIHYSGAKLHYEVFLVALFIETPEVHAKHRYAIHMVGESPALEAVELPFHLGKEGVRKVRPEGFYILIRPAVLHLNIQVAYLLLHGVGVKARVGHGKVAEGLQTGIRRALRALGPALCAILLFLLPLL